MTPLILSAALLLDAILGEPRWLWSRLPHPAVLMGRAIGWCDRRFNRGSALRVKGALVVLVLSLAAGLCGWAIATMPLGWFWSLLLAAILLAQRSLVDHVDAVAEALRVSLPEGRRAVSMIVGRDTRALDATAVSRAAIESAAENLSDGVIAPAFWFLVGGLPGMLVYKLVNTADSMIGHRTPRHRAFGWAAARLDDAMNYVPARLTACLLAPGHLRQIWTDGPRHRSVNAGFPEAAMAYGLGLALSGPRSYGGAPTADAVLNANGTRAAGPGDIAASIRALWRVWAVLLVVTGALALI